MNSLQLLKGIYNGGRSVRAIATRGAATLTNRGLSGLYELSDRRPWRLGYAQYRQRYLRAVLKDGTLLKCFSSGAPLPAKYGYRLDARAIEIPWALARVGAQTGTEILDAGSSLNYEAVVSSTPLNGKKLTIATLAPERRCYWQLGVSYVYGDLRKLLFASESFDAVVCISTIEHIAMDNSRYSADELAARPGGSFEFLAAIRELKRVLKRGAPLLITFPFGRFENHGWFQQFDADLADRLVQDFAPSRVAEFVYEYVATGWQLSDRGRCASCEFFDVTESKYFRAGSRIDFPAHFPAGESAVMCLELTK
jgi:SAM-dependent methyltransferase